MLKIQSDTCIDQLKDVLDRESMEKCTQFIKEKRESRHLKTLERQKSKFDRLCQMSRKREGGHSNMQDGNHDRTCIDSSSTSEIETDSAGTTGIINNNHNSNNNSNIWVRNISSTPSPRHKRRFYLGAQTL